MFVSARFNFLHRWKPVRSFVL